MYDMEQDVSLIEVYIETLENFFAKAREALRARLESDDVVWDQHTLNALHGYCSPRLWGDRSAASRVQIASSLPPGTCTCAVREVFESVSDEECALVCESLLWWDREVHAALHVSRQTLARTLGALTHDLRSPLVTMRGYTDMILGGSMGPVSADQEFGLRAVLRGVAQLSDRLTVLSDTSKVFSGHLHIHAEYISLVDLVRKVLAALEHQAAGRGIELRFVSSQDIGGVWGDADALERVLRELIRNALRATDEGSVSISLETLGEGVRVEVKDTGSGILPRHRAQIFEPFFTWDLYQDGPSGRVGIGLTVVQGIVEAHSAQIHLDSVLGEGSAFSFVLPHLK